MTTIASVLPAVNALLNATAALLLVLGFRAIRAGHLRRHRALMLGALGASLLFLVGYFTRIALTGTHAFPGSGGFRAAYLAILASHTVLAALAGPMILRTLFLAVKARFPAHRRIARATLPVWLYVSVTGVAVYVMLYHLAPGAR
jgi:putative membrane protein